MKYDEFLSQYSLLLRHGSHDNQPAELADDNKENELLFEPLDLLYQKQLNMTPKRKSCTPQKKLRRRAGTVDFTFDIKKSKKLQIH